MKLGILRALWERPIARAVFIHLSLLGGGWIVAAAIAAILGLGVSLLGLLLAYGVVNIALTAWLLGKRKNPEPEIDELADALAEFSDDPLGILIGEGKDRLAKARRGVGRSSAMYKPLDRLVRSTRKIERRLALEPALKQQLARSLTQHLPVIAMTAEQYVMFHGADPSDERLVAAEGVLREAAERLERLSTSDGVVDEPTIGLIRMDANAEFLAEQMSSNMAVASDRAKASRISHAFRRAAKLTNINEFSHAANVIDRMSETDDPKFPLFWNSHGDRVLKLANASADGDNKAIDDLKILLRDEPVFATSKVGVSR